jgi:hypothetical protein
MICTANFIEIDWRNKTQGVWVQDFPYLEEGERDDETEFGRDLRDYLTNQRKHHRRDEKGQKDNKRKAKR